MAGLFEQQVGSPQAQVDPATLDWLAQAIARTQALGIHQPKGVLPAGIPPLTEPIGGRPPLDDALKSQILDYLGQQGGAQPGVPAPAPDPDLAMPPDPAGRLAALAQAGSGADTGIPLPPGSKPIRPQIAMPADAMMSRAQPDPTNAALAAFAAQVGDLIPGAGSDIPDYGRDASAPPRRSPAYRRAPRPDAASWLPDTVRGQSGGTLPTGSDLVSAIIQAESGNDPNAVSPAGASGLMQIMKGTAQQPGYGVKPMDWSKRFDPEENQRFGTDYLNAMLDTFGGDTELALMAYNWGPGSVRKWLKNGADPAKVPAETKKYVSKILPTLRQEIHGGEQFADAGGQDIGGGGGGGEVLSLGSGYHGASGPAAPAAPEPAGPSVADRIARAAAAVSQTQQDMPLDGVDRSQLAAPPPAEAPMPMPQGSPPMGPSLLPPTGGIPAITEPIGGRPPLDAALKSQILDYLGAQGGAEPGAAPGVADFAAAVTPTGMMGSTAGGVPPLRPAMDGPSPTALGRFPRSQGQVPIETGGSPVVPSSPIVSGGWSFPQAAGPLPQPAPQPAARPGMSLVDAAAGRPGAPMPMPPGSPAMGPNLPPGRLATGGAAPGAPMPMPPGSPAMGPNLPPAFTAPASPAEAQAAPSTDAVNAAHMDAGPPVRQQITQAAQGAAAATSATPEEAQQKSHFFENLLLFGLATLAGAGQGQGDVAALGGGGMAVMKSNLAREDAETARAEKLADRKAKAPETQTFYDQAGSPYVAQWDGTTQSWQRVAGGKPVEDKALERNLAIRKDAREERSLTIQQQQHADELEVRRQQYQQQAEDRTASRADRAEAARLAAETRLDIARWGKEGADATRDATKEYRDATLRSQIEFKIADYEKSRKASLEDAAAKSFQPTAPEALAAVEKEITDYRKRLYEANHIEMPAEPAPPAAAPAPLPPEAQAIKDRLARGEITRDEAARQLQALGAQ